MTLTRREIVKAAAAAVAFPGALWAAIRHRKPVYHTITRLEMFFPADSHGRISLWSCGRPKVIELEQASGLAIGIWDGNKWAYSAKCPFRIKVPWELRIENTKGGPGPYANIDWTDEHGRQSLGTTDGSGTSAMIAEDGVLYAQIRPD